MKALQLRGYKQLDIVDLPTPEPRHLPRIGEINEIHDA
jgi:hypothetical protein